MTVYPIVPVAAPRQSRKDAWAPSDPVLRYRAFKDEVKLRGVVIPENYVWLVFVLPMPQSWSNKKRKRLDGMPHQQKPDIDNLIKALLDAVYRNDAHVWGVCARKIWGVEGRIVIGGKEWSGPCGTAPKCGAL